MNSESIIALIRIMAPFAVTVLAAAGIALDADSVANILVILAAGVFSIYTGWKNNNFTHAAQVAQGFLEEYKSIAAKRGDDDLRDEEDL